MGILYRCLFLVIIVKSCNSANILGIFPAPSYSHQVIFHPIYRELSLRGHNVTVLTTNPLNDPTLTNLTEIDLSYLYKYSSQIGEMPSDSFFQMKVCITDLTYKVLVHILEDERFKKIYQDTNRTFDVVLTEGFTNAVQIYGYKFGAPEIPIFSLDPFMDIHTIMGNFIHPLVYGGAFLEFDYPISIWQKLYNCYVFLWNKWHYNYSILPKMDKIVKRYFGKDFPPLVTIEKNISVAIINKNKFMSSASLVSPNVIQVGFMHIKPPNALPKDLADIMNSSPQGVVYFSLGSNVKSANLPPRLIQEIIAGLSALPYTVLWKWESEEVPDLGKNVITRKWFPQQDILAHPHTKVFVFQGGLQSIEEAIARAVPLVGIPFISDQSNNMRKIVKLGIGVKLLSTELNATSLKQAIIEVAENAGYRKKINEIRAISFDEPMTGLDKAIWWIEYMIRHKSAPHLRSAIADIPLYEYLMLDVIAAVIVILLLTIFVLKLLCKLLFGIAYKNEIKSKCE